MSTCESFRALRRANPRHDVTFSESVVNVAGTVRVEIAASTDVVADSSPPRRPVGLSAAAAALAVAAAAAFLTLGSPGGGQGVEDATAAVQRAATVTARSAEQSGTAVVRITRGDEVWATKTVRWHGADVAVAEERRGSPTELRVVDGMLYGLDPDGWIVLGDPASIDPGSGTTPAEYLRAVREDVGGPTLRRLSAGMTGLTTRRLADGATVYSGAVAARAIARETGFKEGQAIRVLPFGYVAHDEAANPDASLDARITVGADGVIRELVVRWAPAWEYTVTYNGLGTTPSPLAPANARPFPDRTPR